MKLLGNLVAIVAILVGVIWALQGANLIGGSVMSGQSQWLYIGVGLAVAGLVALWWLDFVRRPTR
jgi:hypothetical protein